MPEKQGNKKRDAKNIESIESAKHQIAEPITGRNEFLEGTKRSHQVKVSLNQEELTWLNDLVFKVKKDKASVFRELLENFYNENKEGILMKTFDTDKRTVRDLRDLTNEKTTQELPVAYLKELKELFESKLISEEEYNSLRKKALKLN